MDTGLASTFFFLIYLFLIGGLLLYIMVLVSAIYQMTLLPFEYCE